MRDGDADHDHDVDTQDLAIWQSQFGGTPVESASAAAALVMDASLFDPLISDQALSMLRFQDSNLSLAGSVAATVENRATTTYRALERDLAVSESFAPTIFSATELAVARSIHREDGPPEDRLSAIADSASDKVFALLEDGRLTSFFRS